MIRRSCSIPAVGLLLLSATGQAGAPPERVGRWRVEIGPPGNEAYQQPISPADAPPALAVVLERVARVAPAHTSVSRWEVQAENRYFVRAEAGPEEYDFLFAPDGALISLDYDNEWSNIEEEPGDLILPGSKASLPVTAVPKRALESIAVLFPRTAPTAAWRVETPAGPRYVVAVSDTAFFVRPDGQIQAAGSIAEGAMDDVRPDESDPGSGESPLAEAEKLLGPHRERFEVAGQISRLGPGPDDAKSSFRFVVMGDSRSQPDLWGAMVGHIDSLEPRPRFVINTGDVVSHGYVREYAEYFLPPLLEDVLPFFVAIGNHDDGDDTRALEYRYLFGNDSLSYFFDYGGWRFVFLDNVTSVSSSAETLAWLEGVLRDTPEGRRIVVSAHKPIGTVDKWAYHSWDGASSERFTELMASHQIAHVFFGHIHAYSTASARGVPYTITGGGGAGLHNRYGPQGNVHHYIICDVAPDGSLKQQVVRFFEEQ